ncbi:MAG: hypothetical protein COA79_17830 [Planctomycetota bacterium]|nr:MAG: hypothetical protein COA79_17830 [Planctomycetota bacterium]
MVVHGIEELSYLDDTEATVQKGEYSLTLKTNTKFFKYKIDQKFQFYIFVEKNGVPLKDGYVEYELKWDQSNTFETGRVNIISGEGKIDVMSSKAGFILAICSLPIENDEILTHHCGVAISPELIEPSLELPSDFNSFWDNQKKLLAEIPIETSWISIDHKSHPHLHEYSHKDLLEMDISNVEINEVKVSCLEKDVSGLYIRPKKRSSKNHPAMLCVQGAGVMPTRPHNFIEQANNGILVYEMGAHGLSNLEEEFFYQNLIDGKLKKYLKFGREDRMQSYFRLMFLRVKRGLDFLMSQPEWDGKTIVISGSSQGAVQSMAGAYLEPKVSMISARVPALCDHTGFLKGRSVGGGDLVIIDEEGNPDPDTLECSRYFDGVNFMRQLTCTGTFSVGLNDGGCTPSSIYAAYNSFKGPKSMYLQPYTGHANTPATLEKMKCALEDFIRNR